MKLFEKFRWLPIDRPAPGTADVSGNSCVLATFVGDTPGTSNARSRKFRPFSGRLLTSACETVAAIWLRAASRIVASADTVTLASIEATVSEIGSSKAEPTVNGNVRVMSVNPSRRTVIAHAPTRKYGHRKRPV